MGWRNPSEHAALGFLGYGTLTFLSAQSWILAFLGAFAGALVHGGFILLRPLPWRRYFLQATQRACVQVHPSTLAFGEISRATPDRYGFIRFLDLDKRELYKRLEGKRLDKDAIPFHMRVILEESRMLETSWDAVAPYIKEYA